MYQTQGNSNKVKILTIDSLFRDTNSSKSNKQTNHFQVTYDEPINNVSKLELVEYSGPTSVRIISDKIKNNVFKIKIIKVNGKTLTQYVKTPDIFRIERNIMNNNSLDMFVQNINSQLTKLGVEVDANFGHASLKFLHDIDSNISNNALINDRSIYFQYEGQSNIYSVEVDFTKDENDDDIIFERSLGYILGFRNKSIKLDLNGTIDTKRVKSESSIDLNNNFKYAYLVLDDNTTNSDSTIVTQNMKSKGVCSGSFKNGGNIIGKIIYRNELNYNFYNRVISTPREYFGNVDLVKFSVALVNEYGEYIDTQNMDWSFTLKLTTHN